jgi:ubiquinone/menaquinone biosynthesis C-methylase UbiE/DNA-binding transcriptional ArsR family regulator
VFKEAVVSENLSSLDDLVLGLKAVGEETRLRILALLAEGDLNVSDLTDILGQSQPRISRHLKLLVEAGLVERHREGSWAFFRLAENTAAAALARGIISRLDAVDERAAADRARLLAVRAARSQAAQVYFARHAADWDHIRALHAPEAAVEDAIRDIVGITPVRAMVDLGTGTGRMLTLLAPIARRVVGVDASHAMLAVARAGLERAGLNRVELRQGDIYAPPVERGGFDLVIIHQVLHFLDDPARALREASALLSPGGRLLVIDFAPHSHEFLRDAHAHRRLGFRREEVSEWLADSGLDCRLMRDLAPQTTSADQLTVSLWLAQDQRVRTDWPLAQPGREVA